MAYNKLRWKDRSVQHPGRYRKTDNGDGTVDMERAPGEVYEEGTNVSAGNMNNMESGVDAGHSGVAFLYTILGILDQSLTKWVKNVLAVAEAANAAMAKAKTAQESADAAHVSVNTVSNAAQRAQQTAENAGTAASAAMTAAEGANNNANGRAKTKHADAGTAYGLGTDALHGHVKLSDETDSDSGVSGGVAATPAAVKKAFDKAATAQAAADGKAPSAHTSAAATGSALGHVKLSDATNSTSGAGGGVAATPAAVKAAYDKAAAAQTAADGKAPSSHASTGTGYGAGSGDNYGHVKLSDEVNSTSDKGAGVAATPYAVKLAYDLASSAKTAADGKAPSAHTSTAATSSALGHVKLSDATNSTSVASGGMAATPYAVKLAYDKAAAAASAAATAQSTADGKAPKAHASSATTYGAGSGDNYGHVKLSDSISSTSGAGSGIAATPAAVKTAYDKAVTAQSTADGKAPTSHASSATTYGKGTKTNYGHLRLLHSVVSESSEDGGYAATPYAVKLAYDKAAAAANAASAAQTTANNAWSKSVLTFKVVDKTLYITTK